MKTLSKVLIIGFVWPEPKSSAAGSRMIQLIELFQKQNMEVHFVTTASETIHMVDLSVSGVVAKKIQLNHDSFDEYLNKLSPDLVLFDRFITEEQFGWRALEQCPDAIRILDTEDLHCLRKTRQEAFKKGIDFSLEMLLDSDIAKRELASIYRCDLSLIISTYEIKLLKDTFKIDDSLLCYLPFLIPSVSLKEKEELPSYKERQHFMCVGNFRHEPNWNMVLYLKQTIWPIIKKQLPKTEMHVYGSYPSEKVTQLNNIKEGFLIKGWADNVNAIMLSSRVCLAPIRFGAGIKGKFTDAMKNGLPSITTSIGAEGMAHDLPWGGSVVNNPIDISNAAVNLYNNKEQWLIAQQNGFEIINNIYSKTKHQEIFLDKLILLSKSLSKHRSANFIGAMLGLHTLKSSKYLSKWISEKEKNK